jgi:hypothetical protein
MGNYRHLGENKALLSTSVGLHGGPPDDFFSSMTQNGGKIPAGEPSRKSIKLKTTVKCVFLAIYSGFSIILRTCQPAIYSQVTPHMFLREKYCIRSHPFLSSRFFFSYSNFSALSL